MCIGRRCSRKFVRIPAAQFGNALQHLDEKRRLVAFAFVACPRLIGRIGFQQQAFRGQRRDHLAQALRAFVGDRAADADEETELPQFARLFGAAGKAVHHAAQRFAEAAQFQNHFLERTARVQHQWQVEAVRDFEMAAQQTQLAFVVGFGLQPIQSAFAHRGGRMPAQPIFQCGEIRIRVLFEVTRVQPVRRMQARFGVAKRVEFRPAGGGHRGHQHLRDASRTRVAQYPYTINVEFRRVQMRVAVEQPRGWARLRHWSRLKPNMNRFGHVDERFIVGLFESTCHHQGPFGRETTMKRKAMLARAILASLGIVAIAVLAGCGRGGDPQAQATPANMTMATSAATAQLPPGEASTVNGAQAPNGGVAGAQPQFAQVVAVQPITQSTTTSNPRQECHDEQVAVPETYKDKHQIGGAVVGGLVGALAGHQIGGGKGKTLATVGGAAAGAFAGHEIQKKHQENNATKTETRNVCHTVTDKSTSTRTVGYDVTYTLNGQAGHIRMDHNPGVGTGLPVRNGVVVANGKQGGSYYQ